jgi:hypothetical protein
MLVLKKYMIKPNLPYILPVSTVLIIFGVLMLQYALDVCFSPASTRMWLVCRW